MLTVSTTRSPLADDAAKHKDRVTCPRSHRQEAVNWETPCSEPWAVLLLRQTQVLPKKTSRDQQGKAGKESEIMTIGRRKKLGRPLSCNLASAEGKLSKQKLEEKFTHGS